MAVVVCVLTFLTMSFHIVNAACGQYAQYSLGMKTNDGSSGDIAVNMHVNDGDWVGWSELNNGGCNDFETGWDYFDDFADILPYSNIDGVAIYIELNRWNLSALKWNEPTKEIEINYFCNNILYNQNTNSLCGLHLYSNQLNTTTCSPFYAYQNATECSILLVMDVSVAPWAKQWNFQMPHQYDKFLSNRYSVDTEYWMTASMIGLLGLMVNVVILIKTMKHRKSRRVNFTTKHFQCWPFLCIICGCIFGISAVLKFYNGLCYFMVYVEIIALFMQLTFMGHYQLYRLYYCFANKQIHSDKGYPICLFIIMYIIGIIAVIFVIIGRSVAETRWICGINQYWKYYEQYYLILESLNVRMDRSTRPILWAVIASLYLFWDIATLLLYSFKIKFIRKNKKQDINDKRILNILYTVLIPTLFYQIMGMLIVVIATIITFILQKQNEFNSIIEHGIRYILTALLYVLVSIIYSYSIFLMLEHNNSQYIKFLKRIRDLKLNYICCCYRNMVINAIQYNDDVGNHDNNDDNNDDNKEKSSGDTLYDTNTHGISTNHGRIVMIELSPKTSLNSHKI